jgi:two-component system chemotaxis response regulator CheB
MPRLGAGTPLVAIGASTGGVGALQTVITRLPAATPGILVTQHMPPGYTARFAARLDGLAAMRVMEATDRQPVQPGCVYIAPGGRHLELARTADGFACRVHDGEPVSGHRPSVDVLFHSVALHAGARAVGVILTGMGNDGAAGLLAMRGCGAHTIGESEATCVVYGMPRAAAEAGAVGEELPIQKVADALLAACAAASHGHAPSRPARPSPAAM